MVHHGDRRFEYILVGDSKEWQDTVWTDLKNAVRQQFALKTDFDVCKTLGTDNVVKLLNVSDLADAFEDGKRKHLNIQIQVILNLGVQLIPLHLL